jgi:hypothetical protein
MVGKKLLKKRIVRDDPPVQKRKLVKKPKSDQRDPNEPAPFSRAWGRKYAPQMIPDTELDRWGKE